MNYDTVTASYDTLMRQASMTADEYLHEAIRAIDRVAYPGYALKHPELIGTFMQVAAADFTNACRMKNKGQK